MLGPVGRVRVFVYRSACDMRKGHNTLAGLVSAMGHEVTSGDVFIFASRNKQRAKVLWHDGTGLCLLAKRLDAGTFAALWDLSQPELAAGELRLFLNGCKQIGRIAVVRTDVASAGRIAANSFA